MPLGLISLLKSMGIVIALSTMVRLPGVGVVQASARGGDCAGPCSDELIRGIQADCETRAKPTGVRALKTDGTTQAALAGDRLGRVYSYDLDGSIVTEVVPPDAWDPLTATDAELSRFGYLPRPDPPLDMKPWMQWISKLAKTRRVASDLCITGKRNVSVHDEISGNWGGGMSINNSATVPTFYSAEVEFYQTGFDNVCPSESGYSTWSGLGGYNKPIRLMQTGTAVASSALNGIYAWWEMLTESNRNTEVMFSGSSINPGDDVDAYTFYDANGRRVWFSVSDYTKHTTWSVGPISSYAGLPTSAYYDGTTADYITEEPVLKGGGLLNLRKPHLNTTYIFRALPNSIGLLYYPSWRYITLHFQTLVQDSTFDGVHAWSDRWVTCY